MLLRACSGRFSPADGGASIVANGYTGALHMWRRSESNGSAGSAGGWSDGRWVPHHVSGLLLGLACCDCRAHGHHMLLISAD